MVTFESSFKSVPLRCLCLLRMPALLESYARADYAEALHALDDVTFAVTLDEGVHLVRSKILTISELTPSEAATLPPRGFLVRHLVDVSLDLRPSSVVTISTSDGSEPQLTSDDVADLERSVAADTIAKVAQDLVFAANMALPGALCIAGGSRWAAGHFYGGVGRNVGDSFELARDTTTPLGWPRLRSLKVSDAWRWLDSQPGFRDGFGGGPVGRALNALTHVHRADDPGVVLMWAMIGLEAIFTSGKTALLQQLRDHSRLLLGESAGAYKLISTMYDLRSRLVHGDFDFAGTNVVGDAEDRVVRSREQLTAATDLAVSMLLASIQELIIRNWRGVRFDPILGPFDDL